jgi:ATP-dependent DNA helicase RecG
MSDRESTEYELQFIKGIGPKRAEVLYKFGVRTLEDLIAYFPRKYVDRRTIVPLNQLKPDQEITVIGRIESAGMRRFRKQVFYLVISDGQGVLEALWFNSAQYFQKLFKVGEWISLYGKVGFYRGYQMIHPDYDRLGDGEIENMLNTGKILAFYPGREELKDAGINSHTFRKIFYFLDSSEQLKRIEEILPQAILEKRKFPNRWEAFRQAHLPEEQHLLDSALMRLKYEEFFFIQIMLALTRTHVQEKPVGFAFTQKSERLEQLYQKLPFQMTEAQKRVVREIRNDMRKASPMNRLLQGDVGSGKTLVAMMAILIAIDNGKQAALMAPTEILAEQHFLNISKLLEPLGVTVSLLTGSTGAKQRAGLARSLNSTQPHLVIGTHALIQENVGFTQLGLIVIDEQHRFGVMQRGQLIDKGINADVLVMTATPIPRTLALTAYGSLDISVIDEMPANRQPITTVWRFDNQAGQIYDTMKEKLRKGEQAYVVYPLVEESEKLDLKAATEGFEQLSQGAFKDFRLGLLHGRMNAKEKDAAMKDFAANRIQLLVSTTVIEVGVDVANATVMLIEHAERFGLAQLHQMRGRVGRGEKKSFCILKTPFNIGDIAQQRMKIMTETNDGFVIAEKDLEIRGWGDFFGTKQSGMPDFRLANPITDREILEQARADAFELVGNDPFLRRPDNSALLGYLQTQLKERMDLINIS